MDQRGGYDFQANSTRSYPSQLLTELTGRPEFGSLSLVLESTPVSGQFSQH